MKYYLVAGERSGDLHGGNLVRALQKHDPEARFRGFGGDYMKSGGVDLTVHYDEMALMGFGELAFKLRKIFRFIRKCKDDILSFQPDVVILIDYGGFNTQIAKFCKKKNVRVFYYITPKLWAWYQSRARILKNAVDKMFVILPFEKDFYRKYDWDVDYVGNPVLDAIKTHVPDPEFRKKNNLENVKPLIALLPGSRKQELKYMIPVLADVARQFPNWHFGLAAIKNMDEKFYAPIAELKNATVIMEDTYNLLLNADAAVVTSGTATLETGLLKVPQVVVYKSIVFTYWFVKMIISVKFISLINLISGKEVVRELIQSRANAGEIAAELKRLLEDEKYRSQMLNEYDKIYRTLDIGVASENAARLMVKYLKE